MQCILLTARDAILHLIQNTSSVVNANIQIFIIIPPISEMDSEMDMALKKSIRSVATSCSHITAIGYRTDLLAGAVRRVCLNVEQLTCTLGSGRDITYMVLEELITIYITSKFHLERPIIQRVQLCICHTSIVCTVMVYILPDCYIYQHRDCKHYAGEVSRGRICGQGTMWYVNGTVYSGMWKDDKKNGKGADKCLKMLEY